MGKLEWAINKMPHTSDKNLRIMTSEEVLKAREFHKSFKEYSITPLQNLKNMSNYLGLKNVFVKDESYRFSLNAFKVLGGSFAIAKYIAKLTKKDVSELPFSILTSDEIKKQIGDITFFTATDGNHGRGVAWAANKLKQKCVVLMPKGSTELRKKHIADEGAKVTIEDVNYDECVRRANKLALALGEKGVMVQDTAWDGYEEIPSWIMQGYGTMALEAMEQLEEKNIKRPTHIFIQAGVGSLAGAVVGYFSNKFKDNPPKMVVVEAEAAACLYKGAKYGDGSIKIVDGDMFTIMAGLACGEPNTISWDILKNHVDVFISCPDDIAARGMRMLAAPIKGDPQVVSGESGAPPFGVLATIMKDDNFIELRKYLNLNENSEVLLFSTEGNTDPDRYKSIIWEGKTGREDFEKI